MSHVRGALQDMLFHLMLITVGLFFNSYKHVDRRFRRAVGDFEAVYAFSTPTSARSLVFADGKIRTRRGRAVSPDYEIILLDPPGILHGVMKNPNDMITLVIENRIDQKGNLFYLYKLGYLAGLVEARLRAVFK